MNAPSSRTGEPQAGQRTGFFHLARVLRRLGYARDLGDDIVAPSYEYAVAYLHFLFEDIAVVVERRAGDGHAADIHGLEDGERVELGAPRHLPHHIAEHRRHLVGAELVGYRPLGELVRVAYLVAKGDFVHLEHHAVDEKIQTVTLFVHLFRERERALRAAHRLVIRLRLEALRAQKFVYLALRGKLLFGVADIVRDERDVSLRGDGGIEK